MQTMTQEVVYLNQKVSFNENVDLHIKKFYLPLLNGTLMIILITKKELMAQEISTFVIKIKVD